MIGFAFTMNGHFQFGATNFGRYRTPWTIRRSFAIDERNFQMKFTLQCYSNARIGRCVTQIRQRLWFAGAACFFFGIKKKPSVNFPIRKKNAKQLHTLDNSENKMYVIYVGRWKKVKVKIGIKGYEIVAGALRVRMCEKNTHVYKLIDARATKFRGHR